MMSACLLQTAGQWSMSDKCTKCGNVLSLNEAKCSVCGTAAKPPNVRIAERAAERQALQIRLAQARAAAVAQGAQKELDAFSYDVGRSVAVMNRHLSTLHSWMEASSPLFLSFHRQIDAGRVPQENEWDEQRAAAESAINPFCYLDINFAALALSGSSRGMTYYGAYSVYLRDITIEDRSTVFEENPFIFNRKHQVFAGTAPPKGYRAPWHNRSDLAVAKLGSQLRQGMSSGEFAEILMEPRGGDEDCDFIEVHIYGPINRAGIDKVVGPIPKRKPDQVLLKKVQAGLATMDIDFEVAA